jgi:hypothetical protein
MSQWSRVVSIAALGALVTLAAQAQDKCSVKGVIGGRSVAMSACAAAYYEDEHGVTLWFDAKPIAAADAEAFQSSSYAPSNGHTLFQIAFCPGGGKATPDAKAVKSIELRIDDAQSPLLGQQWVFALPKDAGMKIEGLSGKLELGGTLSGHITGQRSADGKPYSWDIDFQIKLPTKSAAAGPSCSS